MSQKHPIIAVTGASGAGTTVVKRAFETIFRRESLTAAFISGECFRRYDRNEMQSVLKEKQAEGASMSPYGPEVNRFDLLESLFDSYAQTGTGQYRRYISREASDECNLPEGWAKEHNVGVDERRWADRSKESNSYMAAGICS